MWSLLEKRCTRCREWKPLFEFGKDCTKKSGLAGRCRDCDRKRGKRWKKNNPTLLLKQAQRWRKKNQDKMREYDRQRRDKLTEGYLKKLIHAQTGCPSEEIPPEFIEFKGIQITMLRNLKKIERVLRNEPDNQNVN